MTGFVCDLDHEALPFRYCATKGCTWTEAPTPPLVAASPVPPVVPDSDPFGPLTDEDRRRMREFGASGSGVVPDKPALAPDEVFASKTRCPRCSCHKACFCSAQCGEPCCGATLEANASVVPAVTDDEAATAENALAARLHQVCRFPAHKGPQVYWDCFVLAREALTALRSAGFLIVHHTKET